MTVAVEGGRCRAAASTPNRASREVTGTWPEFALFGRAIGSLPVILDIVAVTLGTDGRPDAARLSRRRAARSDNTGRRVARQVPATLLVIDLLWLEGHTATELPYRDRRRLLDDLRLEGEHWRTPSYHDGDGDAVLAAAGHQHLPGVIAKRLDSPYVAGRSELWRAVSANLRQ
jgi:bifunctional non-homologous end joining protein LigD